MTTPTICDACECVSHCSKNGCIPFSTELPLRNAAPGSSGGGSAVALSDERIDAALEAWFENGPVGIEHKTDRSRMRAAIAAAGERA